MSRNGEAKKGSDFIGKESKEKTQTQMAFSEGTCGSEAFILWKKGMVFSEDFLGISQSGSNMRTEILAGITTFITVAYILILNPQVLSDPFVITGDMAMAAKVSNGVFIGTCIGTFLCAVYAKVPLAQAPGMGLNAFFAYTVMLGMGYTYNQTLTYCILSGAWKYQRCGLF